MGRRMTAGVAGVKLSEHFACHLGKIAIVRDKRKNPGINRLVVIPGDTMHVGHIKLLFYQSPNMLEQITSLGSAIDFFLRNKLDRLHFPGGQIYFADMSVDQDKGVFVFFIEKELL